MEYVAGSPSRRIATTTSSAPRTLELFARVCEGVQHAHQKAIIHRDLKPSNILVTDVDGRAAPKIIDFGVAKALTQADRGYHVHARGSAVRYPAIHEPGAGRFVG